jgi:hypothetical protein
VPRTEVAIDRTEAIEAAAVHYFDDETDVSAVATPSSYVLASCVDRPQQLDRTIPVRIGRKRGEQLVGVDRFDSVLVRREERIERKSLSTSEVLLEAAQPILEATLASNGPWLAYRLSHEDGPRLLRI